MQEHKVRIPTAAGAMTTYIFHPDGIDGEGRGPWPPIVFYMDAPGMREELRDMARRIAAVGYYVALPDLYYRSGEELCFAAPPGAVRSDADTKRMFELVRTLAIERIVDDTDAIIHWLDAEKETRPGGIGVVGYCMSGPFAFALAGAYPNRIAAAASIYGVRLIGDAADSPHLTASKIRGELYFACAEHDEYFALDRVEALKAFLPSTGIRHRVELYPGAHHGFAFPERAVYDKAAAERHWERLFALFARNL